MSAYSRQRRFRLRDFQRRYWYDGERRSYRDWRYVIVHPFADDLALLDRLGMAPSECRNADVWWATGKDVVLLQTRAVGEAGQATVRIWCARPPYLSIIARLPDSVTTIQRLHETMDRIASCGLPRRFRRDERRETTIFRW